MSNNDVAIYDCRKRDKLTITRLSGDLVLKIIEISTGEILFEEWFQLKKPHDKNYKIIKEYFIKIKKRLERQ